MLIYRMITNEYNGICKPVEHIRNNKMYIPSDYDNSEDIYSHMNTFADIRERRGIFFYFYAEDAVRFSNLKFGVKTHDIVKPHVVGFNVDHNILAEHMGLGVYRGGVNNDKFIALEFAIPYDIFMANYSYRTDDGYKFNCITDKIYPIVFNNDLIPTDIRRDSYNNFHTVDLPYLMNMFNVKTVNNWYFDKYADPYSIEEASAIIKKLNK